jgi:hypothetical protein
MMHDHGPRVNRIVCLVLLAACSKSEPSDRVTCEQYFDHVDKMTDFHTPKPYNDAEIQYCESHTQEQLRCALAASDTDQLLLCELADTAQRAVATRVLPEIRKSWPGTATPNEILMLKREGCAFNAVVGGAVPPTDQEVRGAFVVRMPGQGGDPMKVIVRLRRAGADWDCIDEGDAHPCQYLKSDCRPGALDRR